VQSDPTHDDETLKPRTFHRKAASHVCSELHTLNAASMPRSPTFRRRSDASDLDADGCDLWLAGGMKDVAAASDLLKSCDARLMRRHPVSTRIHPAVHDGAGRGHAWNSPRLKSAILVGAARR
jgi:hypothetical protein